MKASGVVLRRSGWFGPACAGVTAMSVVLLAGSVARAQSITATMTVVVSPWGAPPPPLAQPMYGSGYYLQPPMVAPLPGMIPPDHDVGQRILMESLGGLGMGVAFALGGGLIGYGLGSALSNGSHDGFGGALGIVYGAGLGWTFGVPFGVLLAGRAGGRNGGYGWAFLGELSGSAVSSLLSLAVASGNDNLSSGAAVGLAMTSLVLSVGGAILGFELSSDSAPTQRSVGYSSFNVMPGVSAVPGGGTAGLVGTF